MLKINIHLTNEQIQELIKNNGIDICLKCDALKQQTDSKKKSLTFWDFFNNQIQILKRDGKQRTHETYRATYRKFYSFIKNENLMCYELNGIMMESFQAFLRKQDLSMNSISFYMRIMRAVYNRAVEADLTPDVHPFRHVYTGISKTSKRAITIDELKSIKSLTIEEPELQFARDMFLFSFYTRGMAFVDMAYLKKSDINNGILTYRRHKTGQYLCIQWEKKMEDIVNRYALGSSKYLLPFIHTPNGKERNQYRNFQSKINKDLKIIAQLAGIDEGLTMYTARHSWATIAQQMKVPIEVISRGMGHTSPRTTEIYLKSIDIKAIDLANHQILSLI